MLVLRKFRVNVWIRTSVEARIKRAGGGIEDVNATRQSRADGKNEESHRREIRAREGGTLVVEKDNM